MNEALISLRVGMIDIIFSFVFLGGFAAIRYVQGLGFETSYLERHHLQAIGELLALRDSKAVTISE